MNRIYLDYAASTPLHPDVLSAMRPYFLKHYGNPGSLHYFGQIAMGAIDEARANVAGAIGAAFQEIVFTGGATEANNLILRGAVRYFENVHKNILPRIIVSAIEHESVLETAKNLEREGVEVIYIPVSSEGIVDVEQIRSFLNERTVLVSVMYVNNEIGTVQPIQQIAKRIREFRAERDRTMRGVDTMTLRNAPWPLFHTDAAQAFQYMSCDVRELGVDAMTLSGQKICGPKGVGVLYMRSLDSSLRGNVRLPLVPVVTGGGQEFGMRSGTENVPLIVGFSKALERAGVLRKKETVRVQSLRNALWKGIHAIVREAAVNGGTLSSPHILNVYFPHWKSEDFLIALDAVGIAVSAGSACRARATRPSYVLRALHAGDERSISSIRFSLGIYTTKTEILEVLRRLKKLLNERK